MVRIAPWMMFAVFATFFSLSALLAGIPLAVVPSVAVALLVALRRGGAA